MRRSALLLAPLAAAAALFACEDDTVTGGGVPFTPPDGGGFDAPPLPDAAPDASSTDVTVAVQRMGKPAADVLVVFHDAAGAVIGTAKTGADGKAASSGPTPKMASVLLGSAKDLRRHILTWVDVEAGDQLLASDVAEESNPGTFSIAFAGSFADAGATSYSASVGECTAFTADPLQAVTVFPGLGCYGPQNAALGRAFQGANVVGYAFAKGAPALPTDGGAQSVTLGAWAPPQLVDVAEANPPQGALVSTMLLEVASGLSFPNHEQVVGNPNQFKVAQGFADAVQGVAIAELDSQNGLARLLAARRVAPAANLALDFAAALPAITDSTADVSSPRRPQIGWTSAAPLTASDGGAVRLRWFGQGEDSYAWSFIVPPTATSVKAPAMPAEAADWLPSDEAGATPFDDPQIAFAESDLLAGYRAFRATQGLVVPLVSPTADPSVALPQNGSLKISNFVKQIPE